MQVILKSTTACNASCRYCSAVPDVEGGRRLEADALRPLFEAFAPWLAADPSRRLSFVWHGGEPLLPGLDWFRRAEEEQSRAFGEDRSRVANRLQSNLMVVDDAWVAFLRGFVKSIGTSFDVVEGVRTTRTGGPIARRWIAAVTACREAGIPVGVVYVVHKRSLPRARDIYHFFRNFDEQGRVRFNPLYPEGRAATGTPTTTSSRPRTASPPSTTASKSTTARSPASATPASAWSTARGTACTTTSSTTASTTGSGTACRTTRPRR